MLVKIGMVTADAASARGGLSKRGPRRRLVVAQGVADAGRDRRRTAGLHRE